MLFVHRKGNRRDKYLYGELHYFIVTQHDGLSFVFPGKTDVRYRSAAEFMPHAEWLCATGQPPRVCECRYCPRDELDKRSTREGKSSQRRNFQRLKSRPLPKMTSRATRDSAKPTPSASSRASRRSRSPLLIPTSTSRLPVDGAQNVLGCVRVAVAKTPPSADGAPLTVAPWPTIHELVWCGLEHPITWIDGVIDFWPGIIKAGPKGLDGYLVTLLGNARDVHVSLHAMLPYPSYQVKEAILHELQPMGRKRARIALLDLEEYAGVDMDDSSFSVISSALSFAVSFSVHLATAWSWTANQETGGSVSTSSRSQSTKYRLRSQKHTEEGYNVLWWGPERIEVRQLVQLKMSTSAISIDPNTLATPVSATFPTEPDKPVFLQIHSMSYRRKSQKGADHLTGPVVAGAIFDLMDESQYGMRSCCGLTHRLYFAPGLDEIRYKDLPSPPPGKVFRPWLKESYEIVLPVAAISNRYYWGGAEDNHTQASLAKVERGKPNPIKPITFRPTRAKMLEYAYEMSRNQTRHTARKLNKER